MNKKLLPKSKPTNDALFNELNQHCLPAMSSPILPKLLP